MESTCVDAKSVRWNISLCKHLVWGASGDHWLQSTGWLSGTSSLAPPLRCWPHAVSFPTSCTQLQRAAFPKEEKRRKLHYGILQFFCSISAAPKIAFMQKQKEKKKSFICQDFYLSHMKGYHLLHVLKCFKNRYQRVRGPLIQIALTLREE